MKPIPHTSCPQCGELRTITNKLLATNLHKGEPFVEAFEVIEPEKFESSSYTRGDYFVEALFCRACEIAFIPDAIAAEIGIGQNTLRGTLKPHRPYGLGAYIDDADTDSPVRPYQAMISEQSDSIGVRVEVFARSLEEAKSLIEAEHGQGSVFTLYNEEDANHPR